jgi:hypothetical protein
VVSNEESNFLQAAKSSLATSPHWYIEDHVDNEVLRIFQLNHLPLPANASEPIQICRSLYIQENYAWIAYVSGIEVPSSCSLLQAIPEMLSIESFIQLVEVFKSSFICIGNPDDRFVELCEKKKGSFLSVKRSVVVFLHVTVGLGKTVLHVSCELLVNDSDTSCSVCHSYRNRLRAMHSCFQKGSFGAPQTNFRYLNTPQRKSQLLSIRRKVRTSQNKVFRLQERLNKITGVHTDEHLQNDVLLVIEKHQDQICKLETNDFQRVFWEQQVPMS